jgi:hypothetical protein
MDFRPPRGEGGNKKPYKRPEFEKLNASRNRIPAGTSLCPRIWNLLSQSIARLIAVVLYEPRSEAQTKELARKILDYARMSRTDFAPVLIYVPEMAARFGESHRNVRLSMEQLEADGTVESTHSKDHWKLMSRVYSPVRAAYDAPRVSVPSVRMTSDPPSSLIELQERAHKAKSAQEFNQVMDEMNRLLLAHEKTAGDKGDPGELPTGKPNQKSASSGGQE